MLKACAMCGEFKDVSLYTPAKGYKYGVHSNCKTCNAKRSAEYRKNYPDRVKKQQDKRPNQPLGDSCEACGTKTGRLCKDHDHETDADRGTLCDNCNLALGLLHDNSIKIMGLYYYLVKHSPEASIDFMLMHEEV